MKRLGFDPAALLARLRLQKPLVHHLTNWVTIFDCAQIVKSFGASPVMAHALPEVAEMAGLASALVLNIGTLDSGLIESMKRAASRANQRKIPVVLDACGAGATGFRDRTVRELLDAVRIDIIKGNASEIARVAGEEVRTKGVDAAAVSADLAVLARGLARERGAVVVVTGPVDIVTDGKRLAQVANGHPLMATLVGTGCMAASVIGAFAAVERDGVAAAASGLCAFEIAAQEAARRAQGPGTLRSYLFDAVFNLTPADVKQKQKIRLQGACP